VIIRAERDVDHPAIRVVNEAAFGGRDEADLVEALREERAALLSLVA
jgi:predicted N-acetyltransferase YhbS